MLVVEKHRALRGDLSVLPLLIKRYRRGDASACVMAAGYCGDPGEDRLIGGNAAPIDCAISPRSWRSQADEACRVDPTTHAPLASQVRAPVRVAARAEVLDLVDDERLILVKRRHAVVGHDDVTGRDGRRSTGHDLPAVAAHVQFLEATSRDRLRSIREA